MLLHIVIKISINHLKQINSQCLTIFRAFLLLVIEFPSMAEGWALFMDTHCTDTESVDLMTITIREKEEICLNLQAEWIILPILNSCKTAAVLLDTTYTGHGKN